MQMNKSPHVRRRRGGLRGVDEKAGHDVLRRRHHEGPLQPTVLAGVVATLDHAAKLQAARASVELLLFFRGYSIFSVLFVSGCECMLKVKVRWEFICNNCRTPVCFVFFVVFLRLTAPCILSGTYVQDGSKKYLAWWKDRYRAHKLLL